MNKAMVVMLFVICIVGPSMAAKKPKKPKDPRFYGPFTFTSQQNPDNVRTMLVQRYTSAGYTLEGDSRYQLQFSIVAPPPFLTELFSVPTACSGLQSKRIYTYTLLQSGSGTSITLQMQAEYPGDYCRMQVQNLTLHQSEINQMQGSF